MPTPLPKHRETEITLTRLLARIEAEQEDTSSLLGELQFFARRRNFITATQLFDELLVDQLWLRETSDDTVADFRERVARLSEQLLSRELPTFWDPNLHEEEQKTEASEGSFEQIRSPRAPPLPEPGHTVEPKVIQRSRSPDDVNEADAGTQSIRRRRRNEEQADLAEDLIRMTGALKSNATSFGALIKQDQKVMDSLSTETDTNFTQLKKERDRLRQHAESFWSTAVMMWAMVWITILLFAFTFVVLRVVPG